MMNKLMEYALVTIFGLVAGICMYRYLLLYIG